MKYGAHIIRILFLLLFVFLLIKVNVMLWLAFFAVSLIAALFFGRIYCGYICPMNTMMIPAAWLSKRLKIQTDKTPEWLKKGSFAWIALLISLALMLLSKRVLQINLPVLPLWLALSVLVTLRYKPEVFHNLICPFGALQKVFGRHARLSKNVDSDACIGCKRCEKVCPSRAIVVSGEKHKAKINTALCHQCTNCQQVCPTHAIKYGKTSV
ncbi:MAG: 4Fe-4S binding protein [Ruminococcaceae bacterium]|nr:4Fe-4S binding protein [Oscillospiraceae bacterium]